MSRYTAHGSRYALGYGVDHDPVIGAFVQVWDSHAPDDNNILDLDGLGGVVVTPEMVVETAARYDVPVDADAVRANMAKRPEPSKRSPAVQTLLDRALALRSQQSSGGNA